MICFDIEKAETATGTSTCMASPSNEHHSHLPTPVDQRPAPLQPPCHPFKSNVRTPPRPQLPAVAVDGWMLEYLPCRGMPAVVRCVWSGPCASSLLTSIHPLQTAALCTAPPRCASRTSAPPRRLSRCHLAVAAAVGLCQRLCQQLSPRAVQQAVTIRVAVAQATCCQGWCSA
jgi:hypothetical protein